MAMLPTCIGISGVSRYRKDASNDDSFLGAPLMRASLGRDLDALRDASFVRECRAAGTQKQWPMRQLPTRSIPIYLRPRRYFLSFGARPVAIPVKLPNMS